MHYENNRHEYLLHNNNTIDCALCCQMVIDLVINFALDDIIFFCCLEPVPSSDGAGIFYFVHFLDVA